MKKKILRTSDALSMKRLSHRPSEQAYYILDWRIFEVVVSPHSFRMGTLLTLEGEHITDIYITETGTTELENLSHNTIDIFIIET